MYRHAEPQPLGSARPGMGKGGSGVLKVDGNEVATKSLSSTIPAS